MSNDIHRTTKAFLYVQTLSKQQLQWLLGVYVANDESVTIEMMDEAIKHREFPDGED